MIGYMLAGGAILLIWGSSKTRTSSTKPRPTPSVGPWSSTDVAAFIENTMVASGYSERLAHALIVNAWHESRLDPTAVGDGGASVGLWQLNERGGGAGMTVADRMDVSTSLDRMIELIDDEPAILDAADTGAGTDELTGLVAEYIERCLGCGCDVCGGDDEQRARMATARAWYPDEVR